MADSILREKTKEFAKIIVKEMVAIRENNKEYVLTNQLLRSGTSVGANVHEAQYAQGMLDFVSKLEIALKECFESEYWLELLFETGYMSKAHFDELTAQCGTIRRMLISSCKTANDKINSTT